MRAALFRRPICRERKYPSLDATRDGWQGSSTCNTANSPFLRLYRPTPNPVNSSLRHLGLQGNRIGDVGTASIGGAIESNRSCTLRSLNLSSSDMTVAGLGSLVQGAAKLRNLHTLYLSNNGLLPEGARARQVRLLGTRAQEYLAVDYSLYHDIHLRGPISAS